MKRMKEVWARARPALARLAHSAVTVIGVYLDDLLLVAAGVCLAGAASELGGRPAALAAAGVWCAVYAVVVARSRGGRK